MTCHAARRPTDFQRWLRRERQEVCRSIALTDNELLGRERHQPGESIDDAATETACRVLARLGDRERRVLAEIEAAEARLAAGTFGACEECGRPIPPARLRVVPAARFCVDCERVAELY
jgi:RNA polymerase-binding protein DksA